MEDNESVVHIEFWTFRMATTTGSVSHRLRSLWLFIIIFGTVLNGHKSYPWSWKVVNCDLMKWQFSTF